MPEGKTTSQKKLSERERILVSEAAEHAISDSGGEYYRLGGHGCLPIRYSIQSYPALERKGLVHRKMGYWKATDAGRARIYQEASDA